MWEWRIDTVSHVLHDWVSVVSRPPPDLRRAQNTPFQHPKRPKGTIGQPLWLTRCVSIGSLLFC